MNRFPPHTEPISTRGSFTRFSLLAHEFNGQSGQPIRVGHTYMPVLESNHRIHRLICLWKSLRAAERVSTISKKVTGYTGIHTPARGSEHHNSKTYQYGFIRTNWHNASTPAENGESGSGQHASAPNYFDMGGFRFGKVGTSQASLRGGLLKSYF